MTADAAVGPVLVELPRGWSERVFYAGLTVIAALALPAELANPNAPGFWLVWAVLLPSAAWAAVRTWQIPLLRIEGECLELWRSPYLGRTRLRLDEVNTLYVLNGKRKVTLEFIRRGQVTVQFQPPFLTARARARVIALMQERLPGRVQIDPQRLR